MFVNIVKKNIEANDEINELILKLSHSDWENLYRVLGHFEVSSELNVTIATDKNNRLGEENEIAYATLSFGEQEQYVVTPFDVFVKPILMKEQERTKAFSLEKSVRLRRFIREDIIGCDGALRDTYDLELGEHIDREIEYQNKNDIAVPPVDAKLVIV